MCFIFSKQGEADHSCTCNSFHETDRLCASGVYYCFILHLQVVWAENESTLHHLGGGYFKGPEGVAICDCPCTVPLTPLQ